MAISTPTASTMPTSAATEGLAQGQTIMNRRDFLGYHEAAWALDKPRTQVCMAVDAPACNKLFEDTMMSDWLARSE